MLTPDQMSVAMGAVRDQLFAVCAKHENEAHHGVACYGNRASAIAFLAHCLAVRADVWEYAEQLLVQYDRDCQDRSCPHNAENPP